MDLIKDQQVTYHDWEADHYDDKWSISFDQRCTEYALGRLRKVVAQPPRFERVLEIGCGTGFFLLNLARAGVVGEAWCTDISPGMVAACRANGARLGIDVRGRVADAESLPFDDASFDLVLGHAVLHHLPDVEAALRECRRVLRTGPKRGASCPPHLPGGRLVIAGEPSLIGDRIARVFKASGRGAVHVAAAIGGRDRVLASPRPGDAAALEAQVDLHTFRPAELERLASGAGFQQVRVVTEELTANWFGWFTRTVEGMVGHGRLPAHYLRFAYRTWRGLYAFDEKVARRLVPDAAFYNCILTGTVPS